MTFIDSLEAAAKVLACLGLAGVFAVLVSLLWCMVGDMLRDGIRAFLNPEQRRKFDEHDTARARVIIGAAGAFAAMLVWLMVSALIYLKNRPSGAGWLEPAPVEIKEPALPYRVGGGTLDGIDAAGTRWKDGLRVGAVAPDSGLTIKGAWLTDGVTVDSGTLLYNSPFVPDPSRSPDLGTSMMPFGGEDGFAACYTKVGRTINGKRVVKAVKVTMDDRGDVLMTCDSTPGIPCDWAGTAQNTSIEVRTVEGTMRVMRGPTGWVEIARTVDR